MKKARRDAEESEGKCEATRLRRRRCCSVAILVALLNWRWEKDMVMVMNVCILNIVEKILTQLELNTTIILNVLLPITVD